MKKIRLACMLILSGSLTAGLRAQEVIPASGGEGAGNGGSFSYSAGQVVFTTLSGINGSSLQGVQQPYEIFTSGGLDHVIETLTPISLHPNPVSDHLVLNTHSVEIHNLWYYLYDLDGKMLLNARLTHSVTVIPMDNLVPANYILKIVHLVEDQNQYMEVKTFKIIKN